MAPTCGECRSFLNKYLPPAMMGWLLLMAFIWLANPHRLIIQCPVSETAVAVYTSRGSRAEPAAAQLLKRDGFKVTVIDEHTLPDALSRVDVVVFPSGEGDAADYQSKLGAQGVQAIKDFVQGGGSYVGLESGATFALGGDGLGISAYELVSAAQPSGVVELELAHDTFIAHALQAYGMARESLESHSWYYSGGPVLKLAHSHDPKAMYDKLTHRHKKEKTNHGLDHPHAETLFTYATSVPMSSGKQAASKDYCVRSSGQEASELPEIFSLEDKLVSFMVLYVAPCGREKLRTAGWWEHVGLFWVYVWMALLFLACGGTQILLQHLNKSEQRSADRQALKAPSDTISSELTSIKDHMSKDHMNSQSISYGSIEDQSMPDESPVNRKSVDRLEAI